MIHASRTAPPRLPPIDIDGIRYEQILNGGYLGATDLATGTRLWTLGVYEVIIDPRIESDVQEVYFVRMERVPGKAALLIENERGERFSVDLAGRSVRPAP